MDSRTRIEKLRELIAHPATPEMERRTAKSILARLLSPTQHPWQKRAFVAYSKRTGT